MLGPRTEMSGPPHQEQKLTHNLGVGPEGRAGSSRGMGGGASWKLANSKPPTPSNGNGIPNRIKLGRQNKAIPLNKCSALKQPE